MNEAPEFLKQRPKRAVITGDILEWWWSICLHRAVSEEYKGQLSTGWPERSMKYYSRTSIELKVKKDYERFALIVKIVDKTLRYTRNFNKDPSPDHLRDIIACAAMLAELDQSTALKSFLHDTETTGLLAPEAGGIEKQPHIG